MAPAVQMLAESARPVSPAEQAKKAKLAAPLAHAKPAAQAASAKPTERGELAELAELTNLVELVGPTEPSQPTTSAESMKPAAVTDSAKSAVESAVLASQVAPAAPALQATPKAVPEPAAAAAGASDGDVKRDGRGAEIDALYDEPAEEDEKDIMSLLRNYFDFKAKPKGEQNKMSLLQRFFDSTATTKTNAEIESGLSRRLGVRSEPQAARHRGQVVPVEESRYIPVPFTVLLEHLGKRIQASATSPEAEVVVKQVHHPREWAAFCEQLRRVVETDLVKIKEGLRSSYRTWDPAMARWASNDQASNEIEFGTAFLQCAELAGFTPVSRFDLERTRGLQADLLSLPVDIDWESLDSRWIEDLLRGSGSGADSASNSCLLLDPKLVDLGAYVLVLKRGVSVNQTEGRMMMEKLDSLQSQWFLNTAFVAQYCINLTAKGGGAIWRGTLLPVAGGFYSLVVMVVPYGAPAGKRVLDAVAVLHARLYPPLRRLVVRSRPWVLERWRGLQMRLRGLQVLRQLEPQAYQYTEWLFGSVLGRSQWSEQRGELIRRLSTAWEREQKYRGADSRSDLPEERAAYEEEQALATGNFIERIAIQHAELFSLRSFFAPVRLQEPQFQEVLVAYRSQDSEKRRRFSRPAPQREIMVRRYREVDMKDIKLVMPFEAWNVRGRPVEMIRLDLITVIGCLGVAARLRVEARLSLLLVPLTFFVVRTILGYRRIQVRHKYVTSSMLFDRCVDKDAAVMRMLPEEAEDQVCANCALAFWALVDASGWRGADGEEGVALEEVEARALCVVAGLLEGAGLPNAGFRPSLEEALARLCKWQVVEERAGKFFAIPLKCAADRLATAVVAAAEAADATEAAKAKALVEGDEAAAAAEQAYTCEPGTSDDGEVAARGERREGLLGRLAGGLQDLVRLRWKKKWRATR